MKSPLAISFSTLALLIAPFPVFAQVGMSPADEQASFKVAPGFEVNLFASEEQGVVKPISMRWDEKGRLWVVGSKTYPQIKPGEEPSDQVLILEDIDGDGKADKTTVFADGLLIPTGIEVAEGEGNACYVGEGTKLWKLSDTDGDGKCDQREVVLRGFGTGDNHQNINSFKWSPTGDLVFCQGLHAHSRVETRFGLQTMDQAGLWRYHVANGRLDGFYGGAADPQNPYGWVFTKWGQPIVVAGNSGNMYFPTPEMIRGYQGGKRETIWAQGQGRKESNPEIVESAHFPPEWQGVLLSGGYINNAVWTLQVAPDGSGIKVEDHPSLPHLVQSSHGSFRPVDVRLGPDGALYVCDWFNPIIGHYQASFRHPDRDKVHGRIRRSSAKGRQLLKKPELSVKNVPGLVAELGSAHRWNREQAARVLVGAGNFEAVNSGLLGAVKALDKQAEDYAFRLAQLAGVLAGRGYTSTELCEQLLATKEPGARALGASLLDERLGARALEGIRKAAGDESPEVRLAAIVAAANYGPSGKPEELASIILAAAALPRDKAIETALVPAFTVLKPKEGWADTAAKAGWTPEQMALLKQFDKPKAPPAPAKLTKQTMGAPVVPIYGRTRALPYVLGSISAEVLTRGNAKHGEEIFKRPELLCMACHQVGNQGGKVGPALDAIGSAQPLEFIIGMVLEPQREVKEGFEAVRVKTKKGEEIIGVVSAGNASELTLRDPAGVEHTVAQADIASREMIGSLMPAGLTDNLSPEDLRDLFAYLGQLGKAK